MRDLDLEVTWTSADQTPRRVYYGNNFDPNLPFRDQKERWSDEFERRYLTWLLGRADGNISKAARDADMDRKYLHKLLKKHDIVTSGEGE